MSIRFYVNDKINIDEKVMVDLLREKSLENATFCGNAYKIITTSNNINNININIPDASYAIDNSYNNLLIDLNVAYDIGNEYDNISGGLYNSQNDEKNTKICVNIFNSLIFKNYENDISLISLLIDYKDLTSNNFIVNNKPIISFSYDNNNNILNNSVNDVLSIINSIITNSNIEETYNVNLSIQDFDDPNILGYAIWDTQEIVLNSANNSISYLNDTSYSMNSVVLLHEVFHVLGLVGVGSPGNKFVDRNNNIYLGNNGITQYKNLLSLNLSENLNSFYISLDDYNNINISNIIAIPVEDDFGSGTAHSHFEEGYDYSNGYFYHEKRYINGIFYPVLMNEIMSGFLDSYNYLTPLTLGVLEDVGYTVNYNSQYVTSIGSNMVFK